jgi:hypothetical protein
MSRTRWFALALAASAALASCKAKEDPARAPTPGSSAVPAGIATSPTVKGTLKPGGGGGSGSGARPQCAFITAEDVTAVVGKPATVHESEAPDACGMFAVDGEDVVIVGRRDGGFDAMVGAVPAQYFPKRTDVAGIGDSAVMFQSSQSGTPQLYVRRGDTTIFFLGTGLPEAQVQELARRVVTRL